MIDPLIDPLVFDEVAVLYADKETCCQRDGHEFAPAELYVRVRLSNLTWAVKRYLIMPDSQAEADALEVHLRYEMLEHPQGNQ